MYTVRVGINVSNQKESRLLKGNDKLNTFDQQQDDLFVYDYYLMIGEKYKSEPKCIIKILLFHNLKFMFWYRRFQKYHGLIAKGVLYRLSRKYGLEISPKAQVGKGVHLGPPYNITIGESVVIRCRRRIKR